VVSHDRYFLDRICDQIIAFEDDGPVVVQPGNYSYYLEKRQERESRRAPAPVVVPAPSKPARPRKLSFKEQRELEQLPARIAALEAEQAALQGRLADPAFYQEPAEIQRQAQERLAAVDAEIDAALLRWEVLEAKG